jgi:2-C-methyl-D-erythritol 4-phosphate cytidylyltransferase
VSEPRVWAIVVAGGASTRFGRPKQFTELAGRQVLDRALDVARCCTDAVVLVLPEADVAEGARRGCDRVVAGGATRAASVRAGLAVLPDSAEVVVVHDAARPLATPALFAAVIAAVAAGADGAVPAVPLADTVKRVRGSEVLETLPRDSLVAVQTPQAFRVEVLRRAHSGEPDATDDAGLLEALGARVVVVPGEACNLKLTRPVDLITASALLEAGVVGSPGTRSWQSDQQQR